MTSLSRNNYFNTLYTFFLVNTIPKDKKRGVFLKKFKPLLLKFGLGTAIGTINGFFGAGGGLVCVPILMKLNFERKEAHANAVAVILPITIASATLYVLKGRVDILSALIYIPGGIIGAIIGTFIMKKISPSLIKKLFSLFMIWAGWRLIFK